MDRYDGTSQRLIHPENKYKGFKTSFSRFFGKLGGQANLATQFHDSHDFTMTGNPTFTNIGVNKGMNQVNIVNNYGGVHGLEKMEKFVSFEAQFDSSAQDSGRKCHSGTREEILRRLREWIDDPHATQPIFWLRGPAGAGKTAIVRTFARSCGRPKVAATFLFYRSDPSRNDGNRLFTTLAYQLSISFPAIKDLVAQSLNERPDLPRMDVETQFEQLIVRPLQVLSSSPTPVPASVVVIDGIDECADEDLQRQFLEVIGNAAKDNRIPLRFLISSRPEAHIKKAIDRFQLPILSLDLTGFNADRDVEKYLTDELTRIASEQGINRTIWPGPQKIRQLVYRSSGQFIYASTVIKFVGDDDYSAEEQLDMILGLQPCANNSPFAQLDELYLEVLKRQLHRAFLTDVLSLLVAYASFSNIDGLHKDDAILLDVPKKTLHIKLRRMHSLLQVEPHIVLYHRSFLDFLQDPSRSKQYHIPQEKARKRYLKLITDSLVRYVDKAMKEPKYDEDANHFCPRFGDVLHEYPHDAILSIDGWQDVLRPMLRLSASLLELPDFSPASSILSCTNCTLFQIMRYLLLHLMCFDRIPRSIALSSEIISSIFRPPAETGGGILENDLNRCFSSLLAYLRKDEFDPLAISSRIHYLLSFDLAETVKKISSVSDAIILMYLIDDMTTGNDFISHYGVGKACKAVHLSIQIYARVPVLPRSLTDTSYPESDALEKMWHPNFYVPKNIVYSDCRSIWKFLVYRNTMVWQSPFMDSFLNCDYILPVLWIYDHYSIGASLIVKGEFNKCGHTESLAFALQLAIYIRKFHTLGVVLHYEINSNAAFQCSDTPVKICFWGLRVSYIKETHHLNFTDKEKLTYEANVFIFGCLFYYIYFDAGKPFDKQVLCASIGIPQNHPPEQEINEDAWRLIQRCRAEGPDNRPTMDEVVQELEAIIEKMKEERRLQTTF